MKIYEGQKHHFYFLNKPYYKDSYSIKDLDKHYNKNALSGKFSKIQNTTDAIRTHSDSAVIDLKSCNISTNNITMEKRTLLSIIKSIGPIKSFIKWISSNTKIENKVLEIEKVASHQNGLINFAINDDSFLQSEGILRISSGSSELKDFKNILNSNNDEKITTLLKEGNYSPNVISDQIKKNIKVSTDQTEKENYLKLALEYCKSGNKKPPAASELPALLQLTMPLLLKIVDNSNLNRMDSYNTAMTIAPNLIPDNTDMAADYRDMVTKKATDFIEEKKMSMAMMPMAEQHVISDICTKLLTDIIEEYRASTFI